MMVRLMQRRSCRSKRGLRQFLCMALGVPSCIGVDIAVSGLGSLVVVVEPYPSTLGSDSARYEYVPSCHFVTMLRLQSFCVLTWV